MASPNLQLDNTKNPRTRCTNCQTVFEVPRELLTSSDTRVRCGECLSIFDALTELRDEQFVHATRAAESLTDFTDAGDASLAGLGLEPGSLDNTYTDFDLFSEEADLPEIAYFDQTRDAGDFDFDAVELTNDETFNDTLFVHDVTIDADATTLRSKPVINVDDDVSAGAHKDMAFIEDDEPYEPVIFKYRDPESPGADALVDAAEPAEDFGRQHKAEEEQWKEPNFEYKSSRPASPFANQTSVPNASVNNIESPLFGRKAQPSTKQSDNTSALFGREKSVSAEPKERSSALFGRNGQTTENDSNDASPLFGRGSKANETKSAGKGKAKGRNRKQKADPFDTALGLDGAIEDDAHQGESVGSLFNKSQARDNVVAIDEPDADLQGVFGKSEPAEKPKNKRWGKRKQSDEKGSSDSAFGLNALDDDDASLDQRYDFVAQEDDSFDAPFEDAEEAVAKQKKVKARRSPWVFRGVMFALFGVLLGALLLYRAAPSMYNNTAMRPILETVCGITGCELPARIELSSLKMVKRNVYSHPNTANALVVNVSFRNDAQFEQQLPLLHMVLSNRVGRTVARQDFAPTTYMPNWSKGATIKAGQQLDVTLEVIDPGRNAQSFEFYFREFKL